MHERVADLLSRLTVEEKISLLRATSPGIPRLGIDKYYHGNEALHGVVRPGRFTVFPQAIGLAATWNPVLQQKVATVISDKTVVFLVIGYEMLGSRNDFQITGIFSLQPFYKSCSHHPTQKRIFTISFRSTSPTRITRHIHSR